MPGERRFSQAISEGDGISLLAEVAAEDAAHQAAADGAEAIVVRTAIFALRDSTELPILAFPPDADPAADAHVIAVGELEEEGELETAYDDALSAGLDCVVAVRDEDELQLALERLDPEILLLRGRELERVLSLLPDVPAGKLAIAELEVSGREEIDELERAGVDAVIVPAGAVERLVAQT